MDVSIILRNYAFILLSLPIFSIYLSSCSAKNLALDYEIKMETRYERWIEKYSRKYTDLYEKEMRFGIYKSNVEFIDSINAQNLSYKLSDNVFADMTNEEFKSKYMRLRRISNIERNVSLGFKKYEDLPPSIDWREKGAVNRIKDQGNCGSCWAFSAVASVEAFHMIKTGKLISLSEQELVDCNHDFYNRGCKGGYTTKAFEFIAQNGGLNTETDYPYQGMQGTCNIEKAKIHVVNINGYQTVPSNDENSLQNAVTRQPVSVSVDGSSLAFQLYAGGIFTGPCKNELNHGVTIVGYGEDDGKKYWIVRNSWGLEWGEYGYMRMERDSSIEGGICGMAMNPSFPI